MTICNGLYVVWMRGWRRTLVDVGSGREIAPYGLRRLSSHWDGSSHGSRGRVSECDVAGPFPSRRIPENGLASLARSGSLGLKTLRRLPEKPRSQKSSPRLPELTRITSQPSVRSP
jgi:hypothetical protein